MPESNSLIGYVIAFGVAAMCGGFIAVGRELGAIRTALERLVAILNEQHRKP